MKTKEDKGITLIALIVTIIVLLILSGVTVTTIIKDDGIIQKAEKSKISTDIGREKEEISLAYTSVKGDKAIEGKSENVSKDDLQNELKNNGSIGIVFGNNDLIVYYPDSEREYLIKQDGKIDGYEKGEDIQDDVPGELDGTGTLENPFKIRSIEDLNYFQEQVNSGNTFKEQYLELTNNLDFYSASSYKDSNSITIGGLRDILTSGKGFKPIGNSVTAIRDKSGNLLETRNYYKFLGTFDGKNYEIKNLYMNDDYRRVTTDLPDGNVQHEYINEAISLFGYNEGTIKNLRITDVDITSAVAAAPLGYNFGKIENIKTSGTIKARNYGQGYPFDYSSIAGVLIQNKGTATNLEFNGNTKGCQSAGICINNYGILENAVNNGKIEMKNGFYAAGIAAQNITRSGEPQGIIRNCMNYGEIFGEIPYNSGHLPKTGGIVGVNTGLVEKCGNEGNITALGKRTYAGGICGWNSTKILESYSHGNIIASGSYCPRIGGIAGTSEETSVVESCYNTGSIETIAPSCYTKVGGIISEGRNTTSVIGCYNIGEILGVGTGYKHNGGVVGEPANTSTIKNSFYLDTIIDVLHLNGRTPIVENSGSKTMQEMKTQEFINGMGNPERWKIDPNKNEGYPILAWEK